MDQAHAWRSRPPMPPYMSAPPPPPPPPVNLCPVCSVSHFPFCPSPYSGTPGVPYHDQFYYQAPPPPPPPPPQQPPPPPPPPPQAPYDPFTDHQPRQPAMTPPPPPPRPWGSNPVFDKDQYGYSSPSYHEYSHAGAKRMRVEDFGPSVDSNCNYDGFRVNTDDERRLKLIREHGGSSQFESRNTSELNSGSNFDQGNVPDTNFSTFERREGVYSQELNYTTMKGQYMHRDRNAEFGNSRYNDNVEGNHGSSGRILHGFSGADGSLTNWRGNLGPNAGYHDSRNSLDLEKHEIDGNYGMLPLGVGGRAGQYGSSYTNVQSGMNRIGNQSPQVFNVHPPLPASPPPPFPMGPPGRLLQEPVASTSPSGRSLFPVSVGSSASKVSPYAPFPEANPLRSMHYSNKDHLKASRGFPVEGIQIIQQASSNNYPRESERSLLQHLPSDKPPVIDASQLLKHPHRTTRPDHIVVILRGLPGSGKSYLAKMLRDLEVENGGRAPRIHTMDDYFMTEVEKIEDSEGSKSSGSLRGRKPVTKKVMEYCYEPEMEEAYRSSMLKAFKKTLDEGVFSFIIVDDRNLRVADFAQFWATAKRSGYEVYLLEATYKDPVGCTARNIHGFTQDDIQKMADQWEEAPPIYLKLDIRSLLHGDNLEESGIEEVDMDTEDGDPTGVPSGSDEKNAESVGALPKYDGLRDDSRLDGNGPPYQKREEVKELGKSKWSNNLDDDDTHKTEVRLGNLHALSGATRSHRKEGKSVRWGDEVGNTGFSIGAAKSAHTSSLTIGPGSGYNLKTNPLADEEKLSLQSSGKRQNIFLEKWRAELEDFKAAFDKWRQGTGGLGLDEE